MQRTYRFRLYPSAGQARMLEQWLNTCRHLYNNSLAERKEAYEHDKTTINYYDQANALKEAKRTDEWLSAVHSQVLQDVLRRLDKAFQNFFRRVKNGGEKPGYPRFKSWDRFNSFTFPQSGYKIETTRLVLSKIGAIKMKMHRKLPKDARIKTCAIKRDIDQWYVTFVVNLPDKVVQPVEIEEIRTAVGIDLGVEKVATLSTGDTVGNPKWLRSSEKKLAKEQRELSRKRKGSENRKRQRMAVARVHRKIRNQRMDFYHKLSRGLVESYDLIVFEDLKVKNMVKNQYLAKSISDAGWEQLVSFTSYKAEEAGKHMELINPNGTSQTCSGCGMEVRKSLAVRMHRCPNCGLEMDRDLNAAINILKRGLGTVGTMGRACMSYPLREAMKQEAHLLVGG